MQTKTLAYIAEPKNVPNQQLTSRLTLRQESGANLEQSARDRDSAWWKVTGDTNARTEGETQGHELRSVAGIVMIRSNVRAASYTKGRQKEGNRVVNRCEKHCGINRERDITDTNTRASGEK